MKSVDKHIWIRLETQVWGQVREQAYIKQVWGQVTSQVRNQVWAQVSDQVYNQVRHEISL